MYHTQRRLANFLTASLVGIALTVHPASAVPDTVTVQTVLQSEYDNMNAALAHGELTRYLSYHTAVYSETDPKEMHTQFHGRDQDRTEARHDIQWIKHFNAVNHTQFHYHDAITSLSVTENSITVTAEERTSIQPELVESEQDEWVRQTGRWLMKQRHHGALHAHGTTQSSPAAPSAP